MEKLKLNHTTFRDYIVKFNPLAIVREGVGLSFEGYDSCYAYVFDYLFNECKRGYVDTALLLCELTGMNFTNSMNLVKKGYRNREVHLTYILDFLFLEEDNYQELKELFKFLHSIQGTALNTEMFDKEYKKFILRLSHRINGNNPT